MEVLRGDAYFSLSTEWRLEGRLADAVVRSTGDSPAVAMVSIVNANAAVVAAEKGELLVRAGRTGKSVILHEGEWLEVTLVPDVPQATGANATNAGSGLTGGQVAILGAVLAGTATGIGFWLNSRQTGLTDSQIRDEISPFRLR